MGLAAPPTALVTRTVGMVPEAATIALTVRNDAHGGDDLLTYLTLLTILQRQPTLMVVTRVCSHSPEHAMVRVATAHRLYHSRRRSPAQMAPTRRACPHSRERVQVPVPNDMRAPCPHRSLHLALQLLRPLSAVAPPLR